MVMVRTVQVRLKRDQYARIKQRAELRGFSSLSSYVRYVALDHDAWLEEKLLEVHRHLLGPPPSLKRSRKA